MIFSFARRLRRLMADITPLRTSRDFRVLFGSRTVTLFGSLATEVALLVQARRLTGSAVAVGLLGAVELVPLAVFGLYGGALADRLDRRRLIRWCEAGLGCCAALLVLNASLPRPAAWPLYLIAAVMMALTALQRPSLDASLPRVVAGDQLTAASALLSLSSNASFLTGTALGGVLAAWPGPLAVYVLDAVTFTASLGFLAMLGIFRQTLWNQTIPDALRGRLAGVELLSYALGPSAGQARAGAVAGLTSPRFSLWSGGLACVAAVAVTCAALPGFVSYRARSSRASEMAR